MTKIKIEETWHTVNWDKCLEDCCGDCYEWNRKEYIGNLASMRVYRLDNHDNCYVVEQHFSDGAIVEGMIGEPTECGDEE